MAVKQMGAGGGVWLLQAKGCKVACGVFCGPAAGGCPLWPPQGVFRRPGHA